MADRTEREKADGDAVRAARVELATCEVKARCSAIELCPIMEGAPSQNRTDFFALQERRVTIYALGAKIRLAEEGGVEPLTLSSATG